MCLTFFEYSGSLETNMNTVLIDNIKTVKSIPTGHYLVIYEKGSNPDSGMVLYGPLKFPCVGILQCTEGRQLPPAANMNITLYTFETEDSSAGKVKAIDCQEPDENYPMYLDLADIDAIVSKKIVESAGFKNALGFKPGCV